MNRHLLAALSATALTTGASPALAQDFVMKLSAPVPAIESDVVYAWMTAFEKGVEKASEGRIDVQLFPANQLGQIPATVEGVSMGTIEMTLPVIGFLAQVEPRFQVLDAAGLFDSEEHARRTLDDPEVRAMLAEWGSAANVEPLVILTSGQANVISQKQIRSVADFAGVKMRTGGTTPLLNRPLEALGVSPVAMPLGEVLPAMQTGAIDAATANMAVLNAFQFQDVATEAVYLPGNFTIVGGLISKDFLAIIGPELEEIIREEAEKALDVFDSYVATGPAALEATWARNGGTIRAFDEAEAQHYLDIVSPVVREVVAGDTRMQADFDILAAAAERHR